MKVIDPIALLKEFGVDYVEKDGEWVQVSCPYHKDWPEAEKGKGGVNKKTGAFNCFSCGHDKGGIFGLISTKMNVPESVIHAWNDDLFGTRNKIRDDGESLALVAMCHRNLLGNAELQAKMLTKHGITIDTINKYQIGLHPGTNRVMIPIMTAGGGVADIRSYKYNPDENQPKMVSQKNAKTMLFQTGDIEKVQTVIVTEGEFKAMLLAQHGYVAVSTSHGATSWRDEFNRALRGKDIIIIYDVDTPGRHAALKRCIGLHKLAKSIKNIYLADVSNIPGGDITDYFVTTNHTAQELDELIAKTPVYIPPKSTQTFSIVEDDNEPIRITLAQTSNADFNGKRVNATCVVSAKDTSPYIIAKTLTVQCPRSKDYCTNCHIFDKPEAAKFSIPQDTVDILDLVLLGEDAARKVYMRRSGIYAGCKVCSFVEEESYNVEELRIIPQLKVGHATDEQVTRRVFYVGHGIATNATYDIEARVAAMPDDGHATLVVYKATAAVDNLDDFRTTTDLACFTPKEWTANSICEKLTSIYEDFESNVTRIKMRRDLHLVYDLAFHSVLYIPYEGRNIKGWADVLVIGDSGQGKSEASSRLSQHYNAGERVDSKRASVAGIVGGLQETNKRWFITWGTIPLNDRRLVILEEVKGMGVGELTKLTDMRSSGFAEIHKIERAKTYARTRLIWISNPRSDGKIGGYNYGVDAVRELIGSLEDIRRFDLVIAVASGEVPISVVNSTHTATVPHVYTSDKCSELVQWAWSRKENQVVLHDDAVIEALNAATRLSQDYSSACPIVEPSDQRLKMLRMATALACRTYSTDDGDRVIVRKCHVEAVEALMQRLYRNKALGYYAYSQAAKGEDNVTDIESVQKYIAAMPHAKDCVRGFLEAEVVQATDVQNFTEWPMDRCNEVIGTFARHNCIKRAKRGGYRKTSAFIELLKELDHAGLSNESLKQQIQKGEM